MMTSHEAMERAVKIWGRNRVLVVRGYGGDGRWYVELTQAGIASDTRGRNYQAHQLDGNGHAICHVDCGQLEDAATKGDA